jgi:hypothetical protein
VLLALLVLLVLVGSEGRFNVFDPLRTRVGNIHMGYTSGVSIADTSNTYGAPTGRLACNIGG